MNDNPLNPPSDQSSPFDDLKEYAIRMGSDPTEAGILVQSLPKSDVVNLGNYVVAGNDIIDDKIQRSEFVSDIPKGLPEGITLGDMLYWNEEGKAWVILPAPVSATVLQVLSFDPLAANPAQRIPKWIDTEDCP